MDEVQAGKIGREQLLETTRLGEGAAHGRLTEGAMERTAQVMAFLDKYIPDVAAMETQMKKYHKCFTTAEAEKAVLKAENESLTDKLEKSQQQSTLKKLQDAKLQSDYEAAQAVLERIPPDIIKAYTQRGNRERKVDQYSALE